MTYNVSSGTLNLLPTISDNPGDVTKDDIADDLQWLSRSFQVLETIT